MLSLLRNKYFPANNLKKSGYALFEHLFYSAGNFMVAVTLARFLSPLSYGHYIVAFAVLLFAASIHNSLLLEPYAVYFYSSFKKAKPQYRAGIFNLSGYLGLTFFLLFFFISAFMNFIFDDILISLVGASMMSIPYLAETTVRRFLYVEMLHAKIFWISFSRLIFVLLILFFIYNYVEINVYYGFLIIAVTGIFSASLGFFSLKLNIFPMKHILYSEIFSRHREFGKWSLFTSFSSWLNGNGFLLIIGMVLSIESLAAFKAVQNIFMPIALISTSAGTLLFPIYSKNYRDKGKDWLLRNNSKIGTAATFFFIVLLIAMISFRNEVLFLFYKGKYLNYAFLVIFFSLGNVLQIKNNLSSMALRVSEKVKEVFYVNLVVTFSTLTFGVVLITIFDVRGAAVTLFLHSLIFFYGYQYFLKRL